jgi:hypothetical protein
MDTDPCLAKKGSDGIGDMTLGKRNAVDADEGEKKIDEAW